VGKVKAGAQTSIAPRSSARTARTEMTAVRRAANFMVDKDKTRWRDHSRVFIRELLIVSEERTFLAVLCPKPAELLSPERSVCRAQRYWCKKNTSIATRPHTSGTSDGENPESCQQWSVTNIAQLAA
jgi:hypothetical protein